MFRRIKRAISKVTDAVTCVKPKRGRSDRMSELLQKRDLYLQLAKKVQDSKGGAVSIHHCDDIMYCAMGWGGGADVDIEAYSKTVRNRHGKRVRRWFRTQQHDCLPTGRSKSDISRDMYLGLLWGLYLRGRTDLVSDTLRSAVDDNFIVGNGSNAKEQLARCFINPHLAATMAKLSYRMGGRNFATLRRIPSLAWSSAPRDYQSHLMVLHILLYGEVQGSLPKLAADVLRDYRRHNPRNALFQYGDAKWNTGDYTETIRILLDDHKLFPRKRLPATKDRREPWIFQREIGHFWEPVAGPASSHTGFDLVFLAKLIERDILG